MFNFIYGIFVNIKVGPMALKHSADIFFPEYMHAFIPVYRPFGTKF